MRIGYARVSTDDQTLDLQRDALKRAKCRHTYEEHASGKNTARPELDGCLKALRKDDTLVVPGDTTVGLPLVLRGHGTPSREFANLSQMPLGVLVSQGY
jgi:hypothetical protein